MGNFNSKKLAFGLCICLCIANFKAVQAQVDTSVFYKWNSLFEPVFSGEGYKISFACILSGEGNPFERKESGKECVGGYLHLSEYKYTMDYGVLKTMSDGQLVVMINEIDHSMIVDSAAKYMTESPLQNFIKDSTEMTLKMEKVRFRNREYQAIVSTDEFMDEDKGESIKVKSYILLDAKNRWKHWVEYQVLLDEYTWFEIESYGFDASILQKKINLPKTEVTEFAGYFVFDYRFLK